LGFFLPKMVIPQPEKLDRPSILAHVSIQIVFGGLLYLGLFAALHQSFTINVRSGTATLLGISAVLIALAAFQRLRPIPFVVDRRLIIMLTAFLLVPIGMLMTQPIVEGSLSTRSSLRIMTYNIHQGISMDGWLDPEAIATAIEAQNPDVVVIQEMMRGALAVGSLDVAEWLSRRLRMPYYFAPATDNTYGEALFTKLPVLTWQAGELPYTTGKQPRSYVQVRLDLGGENAITVIGTHLDHSGEKTRLLQVKQLLAEWNAQPRTVIVGDMNTSPNSAEIVLFEASGLISAQDVTGNQALFTFSSINPRARIDWIFGTPDLLFDNFYIPQTTASDHLPVVVDVNLRP
jgi:endonuclease/exonuclease/phosphatase family metal-dependent hydrolase